MKRVTGIGGIFFKADQPEALQAWYKRHLGIPIEEHGASRISAPCFPPRAHFPKDQNRARFKPTGLSLFNWMPLHAPV